MADSSPLDLSSELRDLGNDLEELIRRAESILQGTDRRNPISSPAMRRILHLSLRDLASAHQAVFRASLAESGVVQRVLGAVLGRALEASSAAGEGSSGSVALDPFRTRLADAAQDIDGLVKPLRLIRSAMADCEIDPEVGLPDWPEPVINFAGGLVDCALKALDEARGQLFAAADLSEDRLAGFSEDRPPRHSGAGG